MLQPPPAEHAGGGVVAWAIGVSGEGAGGVVGSRVRWGWMGVVGASGRDLGKGSRVDLRLFNPRFSTDSHLLGENKVIRYPLHSLRVSRVSSIANKGPRSPHRIHESRCIVKRQNQLQKMVYHGHHQTS